MFFGDVNVAHSTEGRLFLGRGETKKATQRAAFSVIYLIDLLFQIDFYLQFVQLFLVDFAGGAEHHIAALIVLWEGNAVAD